MFSTMLAWNAMLVACFLLIVLVRVISESDLGAAALKTTWSGNRDDIAIVDVTMYNGEPIGLLRYYYLYDVVDYFLIVESLEAFSGQRRTTYSLDEYASYFEPLRDKLIILKLDNLTHNTAPSPPGGFCKACWQRESYQRNVAYDTLMAAMGPDQRFVAIVSDVDEVPRAAMVAQLRRKDVYHDLSTVPAYLSMTSFLFNFDWMLEPSVIWKKAFAVTDRVFRNHTSGDFLETLRRAAHSNPLTQTAPTILNAGWHCSNFMTVTQIQQKFARFSHQEVNNPAYMSVENIERAIRRGVNLYRTKEPVVVRAFGNAGHPFPCSPSLFRVNGTETPCLNLPYVKEVFRISPGMATSTSSKRDLQYSIRANWVHGVTIINSHSGNSTGHRQRVIISEDYTSSGLHDLSSRRQKRSSRRRRKKRKGVLIY